MHSLISINYIFIHISIFLVKFSCILFLYYYFAIALLSIYCNKIYNIEAGLFGFFRQQKYYCYNDGADIY